MMKKPFFLFTFFYLLSCQEIGPYRDLEIVIDGIDEADLHLYSLPDSNLNIKRNWARGYESTAHFSHLPDETIGSEWKQKKKVIDTIFTNKRHTVLWTDLPLVDTKQ